MIYGAKRRAYFAVQFPNSTDVSAASSTDIGLSVPPSSDVTKLVDIKFVRTGLISLVFG